jgi:effector-binding domain-containing protein
MTSNANLFFAAVNIGCADPAGMADFWGEVLGQPISPGVTAPDVAHLEHMESALQQTQQTVASLRALLEQPHAPIAVQYRSVAAATAIAISEPVHRTDLVAWWSEAFDELHRVLATSSAVGAGSDGALYPNEFFEDELGEVVAFIPVADKPTLSGRPQLTEIPAAELAVTVHYGAISELDETYGALGTFVAAREIGVQGPIREYYVVSTDQASAEPIHRTESVLARIPN